LRWQICSHSLLNQGKVRLGERLGSNNIVERNHNGGFRQAALGQFPASFRGKQIKARQQQSRCAVEWRKTSRPSRVSGKYRLDLYGLTVVMFAEGKRQIDFPPIEPEPQAPVWQRSRSNFFNARLT